MLRLFDLPPELIPPIFDSIACSRDLKRVMRLRLVSRKSAVPAPAPSQHAVDSRVDQFKYFIEEAIIRLRLLEGVWGVPRPSDPRTSAAYGRVFVLEYLARRAWIEKNPASLLGRIRHAAVVLSEQAEDSGMDAVFARLRALSALALGHRLWIGHHRVLLEYDPLKKQRRRRPTTISAARQQADVCVAAVYLGHRSYVEGLITQGCQFCTCGGIVDVESGVFGPAFKAAAFQGDVPMLRLLISSNPHCRPPKTLPSYLRRDILTGAAKGGHREAFDFALDLAPMDLAKGEHQDVRRVPDYRCLQDAIASTPHPENYLRGAAMFEPGSKVFTSRYEGDLSTRLARKAFAGHLDMVRHFLDKGVGVQLDGNDGDVQHLPNTQLPIDEASLGGNTEVVRLLLERGADPNHATASSALMIAARSGSIPIARMLLDAGARVDDGLPPPIVMAVFREDTDLFRLLRQYGARLDTPETGGWAMAVARFYGLESMVDMLVHEGVDADAILQRCHARRETYQTGWLFPTKLFGVPGARDESK